MFQAFVSAVAIRLRGIGLITRFTLVSAALAALVGGASAWFIETRVTELVLGDVALRAMDQVALGVVGSATAADFEPPYTPARLDDLGARLDAALGTLIRTGSGLIRLKLFARDGTVVYSDLASLRGVAGSSTERLFREALGGKVGSQLSSLASASNADLKERFGSALEVYVPVVLDGQVVGVYEVYQDVAAVRPVRPLVWTTAAVGSGILFLSLFGLVRAVAEAGKLRDTDRWKSELLSIVSHDLRNPLTSILGMASLLRRQLSQHGMEQEARFAGSIVESAKRLNAMIQDLAETSGLEARRLELSMERTDLEQLIAGIAERVDSIEGRTRIRVDCQDSGLPVMADRERIERAVVNLVTNALKYSSPGSPVLVRAEQRDNEAVVSVTDEGVGIRPEDLPHIFEQYYRSGTGRKKAEGLGLGLYITRLLVEANGGRVWAESELGKGSTFFFSLPLAAPLPSAEAPA